MSVEMHIPLLRIHEQTKACKTTPAAWNDEHATHGVKGQNLGRKMQGTYVLQSRMVVAHTRTHLGGSEGWSKKRDLSTSHSILNKAHDYGAGNKSAGEVCS
jgi:hypothetical protein